jgi:aspartate kinase
MFLNGDVLVQKFGGSSMASVERIRRVAERVAEKAARGHRVVVVVSAMGDTTDELINLMEKVSVEPDKRELDQMMATGEMVSSALAAATLKSLGVRARSFNAFNLHLLSEIEGGEYNIKQIGRLNNLARFLEPGSVAVVAGFQGITEEGDLTTLGRGGSDLTAVVLARELGQKVCEKYTDEDGIYTADPRHVPEARKVWHLNYEEMKTLARYGNGILHPRAISCAMESEIRIHVRSSFSKAEGSVVGPTGDSSIPVKSIAVQSKNVISRIEGIKKLPPIFWSELDSSGIKILLREWKKYNQIQGSLRLGFSREEAFSAIPFCWEQAVKLDAEEVENFSNVNTISIVGEGLGSNPGIVKSFLNRLNKEKIFPIIVDHQGIRLSLSVENPDSNRALKVLHDLISLT